MKILSVVLSAFAALFPSAAFSADSLLYYDPDANHQAIVSISNAFNTYLTNQKVDVKFQAVQNKEQFESLMQQGGGNVAIVSAAYVRDPKASVKLKPVLVPAQKGEVYYRKWLMDKGDDKTPFSAKTIAVTLPNKSALNEASDAIVTGLKKSGINAGGVIVVPVGKDIDALLALAFGTVQAALVTPSSFEVLRRINPSAAQQLHKVYETDNILRPPFCTRAGGAASPTLLAALSQMKNDDEGKRALQTMGFDDWVTFQPTMLTAGDK